MNATQHDGTTPLHWAVERDRPDIVQMLIRAGANVKAANRYGATPLWLASVNGNAKTIAMLLEGGADAVSANADGETALMVAARTGKTDAVNRLLARGAESQRQGRLARADGADVGGRRRPCRGDRSCSSRAAPTCSARSNAGFTALLFAAREGRIAAVEALLKAGADMNDSLPVRRRGPQAAAQPLPRPHHEVGLNAFLLAAANAHYELAAWLLDRGADPNAAPQGYTALHQVSWVRKAGIAGSNNPAPQGSGNMDSLTFVRTLVAKGAQLNGARHQAAQHGRDHAQLDRRDAVPARRADR